MDYLKIATELDLPLEAINELKEGISEDFKNAVTDTASGYLENEYSINDALDYIDNLKGYDKINKYQKYLIFILMCIEYMKGEYLKKGISKDIFYQTALDIKYKVIECKTVYGVWGIFCPDWFDRHIKLKIFALGRLQYEPIEFEFNDYTKDSCIIKHKDIIYNCHIPSSGKLETLDVISSFKQAYDFFGKDLKNGVMPIICYSWLLYPDNKKFLSKESNIIKFADMFDIIKTMPESGFRDAWRIFGCDLKKDLSQMPQNTSIQCQILSWLKDKNKVGTAVGVLLFDGEKIL